MTHNKAMAKAVAFSQILSITLLPPPRPFDPACNAWQPSNQQLTSAAASFAARAASRCRSPKG